MSGTEAVGGSASEMTDDVSAPTSGGEEQFTPVVMDVMSTPHWFTGSDGLVHLVYELRLMNAFPIPATVTEVEVRDAEADQVLETLTGDSLLSSMSLEPTGAEPVMDLAPSAVGVVWLELTFEDASELPAHIEHDITISVPPGLPVPEVISSTGARTAVDRQPPAVIGQPLEGPGWLAAGSCCDGPHRRSIQPVNGQLWLAQRFAIDFNRINEAGLLATGDPNLNESWPTYDQPVLAVTDAEVVAAADEFEDQVPNSPEPVSIAEADGNYVILEIDEGSYAFYAHLKPGTVAVDVGDTVEQGEEIGRTGNSGSSSGPHLHFQVMDHPSALVANGLPYAFDQFTVEGRSAPLAELMASNPETDPVILDTANAGPRTDELPLGRDVVEFPTP